MLLRLSSAGQQGCCRQQTPLCQVHCATWMALRTLRLRTMGAGLRGQQPWNGQQQERVVWRSAWERQLRMIAARDCAACAGECCADCPARDRRGPTAGGGRDELPMLPVSLYPQAACDVHCRALTSFDTLYGLSCAQGLRGSAARYVRFLLASTAGYKLPAEISWASTAASSRQEPGWQQQQQQQQQQQSVAAGEIQKLHLHFLSQCEHHMLPFPRPGARGLCARARRAAAGGGSRTGAAQGFLAAAADPGTRLTQQLADALHQHAGMPSEHNLVQSHMPSWRGDS